MNPGTRAFLDRSGQPYVCDAFNFGLVTVRPATSPPEVEVEILDGGGASRSRAVVKAS